MVYEGGVRIADWRDERDIIPALADEIAYRCGKRLEISRDPTASPDEYEEWLGEEATANFEGLVDAYTAIKRAILEAQEWHYIALDNKSKRP